MPLALVTGASRGIGRAIAGEFTDRGWKVLAPSRAELDLRDGNAIRRWCAALDAPKVDALVHSAGVNWPGPIGDVAGDVWADTLQVNLTALFQLAQGVAPRMQGGGRIVALSSILAFVSRPGRGPYSAAKAGVNGFIRALAAELGPRGILANALCPGYIDTDLTRANNTPEQIEAIVGTIPLRRLGTPQEIARLAVWLCSDENTYLTGQAIYCDGGFTCL
jgi:3-oxoacyl-[acyl-carrier protein] reductase